VFKEMFLHKIFQHSICHYLAVSILIFLTESFQARTSRTYPAQRQPIMSGTSSRRRFARQAIIGVSTERTALLLLPSTWVHFIDQCSSRFRKTISCLSIEYIKISLCW